LAFLSGYLANFLGSIDFEDYNLAVFLSYPEKFRVLHKFYGFWLDLNDMVLEPQPNLSLSVEYRYLNFEVLFLIIINIS